ncbi:MAG: beta-glucosidase [Lachnospiraceae bacterium]|nr:beta-glucosidase [Lachnospiraceae bacterium]
MNIQNKTISAHARAKAAALLQELTLDEKLRQLGCTTLSGCEEAPEEKDLAGGIGSIALLDIRMEPGALAGRLREIQTYVMEHSPHRIPALFHCEALSGPVVPGACLYPAPIGLGATFSPETVYGMADTIRRQMRAMGILHALSPVLDVAKDLRWGRINETFGGDPTLNAIMGCAYVDGIQGRDMLTGVAATAKHFLGYSQTTGGLNLTRTLADRRELREVFARVFEAAIRRSGIRTVMNSYSEWNGRPVCASRELLTDLLRGELGFEGLTVSDYRSIQRLLPDILATAEEIGAAALQCLTAGLDMELPDRLGYSDELARMFRDGRADATWLDRAALRVLTLKFELGLFDDPFPEWERYADAFTNTGEAERIATRRSLTLTKNDGILPIRDKNSRIAVIGPCAGSLRLLYGGYTVPSMMEMFQIREDSSQMAGVVLTDANISKRKYDLAATDQAIRKAYPYAKTIFEELQSCFPHCTWTQGCDYLDPSLQDFPAARAIALESDAVILCVGGKNGWGRHCNTGEGNDSASLDLPGAQEALARVVLNANSRTVVVHTDGRPLTSEWIYEHAAAVLEAYMPGTWGGMAIAEAITGKFSPAGRLPLALPRSAGHGPVFHGEHAGSTGESFAAGALNREGYMFTSNSALRPFGYGLSYTAFSYSGFALSIRPDGFGEASVTVCNVGETDSDEVVQLYGRDVVASVVRPAMELIGVCRVPLAAGQSKTVHFSFHLNQLAFPDEYGLWKLEPGLFRFFVGGHSADIRAEAVYTLENERIIEPSGRDFFAEASVTE